MPFINWFITHHRRRAQPEPPLRSSGILAFVRRRFLPAAILLVAISLGLVQLWSGQQPQEKPPAPVPQPAPQQPPTPQQPPEVVPQQPPGPELKGPPPAPPRPGLSTVVLDPGHGGTDAGARGANGVLESEVVLSFARQVRTELERQGLRVVMTRQGNENPSFDDRSAVANTARGAVFVSLHVSSTGPAGTARAYSVPQSGTPPSTERSALIPWDQAQSAYADRSRRLAEIVQIELGQKFRGSPEVPAFAAVRQLRTVATPAVAIELSSVSVPARSEIEKMAPGLADALARAIIAFRPIYEAGVK